MNTLSLYKNNVVQRLLICFFFVWILTYLSACSSIKQKKVLSPTTSSINKIALFLPLSGPYATQGEAVKNGFFSEFYRMNQTKNYNISIYDTNQGPIQSLYEQALQNKTRLIVGPLDKSAVQQIVQLKPKIPVLALNYLLMNQKLSPNIIQFGLSPQNEAMLVAQKAWQSGKRAMVMIYPDSDWGKGIASAFIKTWQPLKGAIVAVLPYQNSTDFNLAIANLLKIPTKNKMDSSTKINFDSVFLVADTNKARIIVPQLHRYLKDYQSIYSLSRLYDGQPHLDQDQALEGIHFCDIPFVIVNSDSITMLKKQFYSSFGENYTQNIRLYAFGMDAFKLAAQFSLLEKSANFSMQGYTGQLNLKNQAIVRTLSWATFKNGVAVAE